MNEGASRNPTDEDSTLQIRMLGNPAAPTLVYLPGTHGDWTLITALRNKLVPHFRFVELTYPRTTRWSLCEYAQAVKERLVGHGVHQPWLIGESFGSQIAWLLLHEDDPSFSCRGIILAGGFVRHPFPWGVPLVIRSFHGLVSSDHRRERTINAYGRYVRRFYETTPETDASLAAFAQRRTREDALAAMHRLRLIRGNDPAHIASACQLPVFSLSGVWDPMVPWYLVTPWLRGHCPGFQTSRLLCTADHNVCFSAPTKSARTILEWLGRFP